MTGMGIKPLGGDDPQRLGAYRLLGRLASGGMGRIYVARSARDGSLVAVKTLLAEGAVSDTDRRRFAREVKLARRIDSAYTARVRDADPDAERPWMAIEYIPAPALSELVRSAGRLPGPAVRWIAAGTAQALVTLHDEGIVHRDVKPQNILLPLMGPRLIDFGISHANDITRTSLTLGTIAFTSPEQARAEPSTTASDVYSLGATLFHLAVGRPPYPDTEDTIRLLTLVQRGELDLTGLPEELAPLIRSCLAADPDERPEPADVLRQFLEELDRTPTSQRGQRWLPPRWTALIEEYAAQGRALSEKGSAPASTDDERTRQVPPPRPTHVYTEERAARREQQERARREEEKRKLTEAQARAANALKAEKQRREQEARQRRKRSEQAQREQREQREQWARAPKSSSSSTPPARSPTSGNSSSDGGFWVVAVLIALALVIWRPWDSEDAASSTTGTSSSSSSSSPSAGTYTGGGTGSVPTSGTYTSGGTGFPDTSDTTPAAPTTAASRTPSPIDEAFASVRAGDCLDAYQDGYGKWSRSAPLQVSCGAANAYLQVRSVATSGSCPSGGGRGGWWHTGEDYSSTNLCVQRQFRNGQCFLAKAAGNRPGGANLLTLWNCSAGRVPREFNYIMQVTAVLPASSGTNACPREPGRYSYSWNVYDGGTMICARVA
ncbi:serine/threonine-protein kinase [Streptomyces sp. NPDC048483]|uniref:serine/threonine-protein kinase n=1 Tax=Streptomyces sp. NPDC048483 TaxID=3154927 RepID=UPI00342D5CE5